MFELCFSDALPVEGSGFCMDTVHCTTAAGAMPPLSLHLVSLLERCENVKLLLDLDQVLVDIASISRTKSLIRSHEHGLVPSFLIELILRVV